MSGNLLTTVAACVMQSDSAARVKLPNSAAVENVSSCGICTSEFVRVVLATD